MKKATRSRVIDAASHEDDPSLFDAATHGSFSTRVARSPQIRSRVATIPGNEWH